MQNINPIIEIYIERYLGKINRYPDRFINKCNARCIFAYIIKNLNWKKDDICDNFSICFIKDMKLKPFYELYGFSRMAMIEDMPCEKIMQWELNVTPKGFWQSVENRQEFVIWLAEREKIVDENGQPIEGVYKTIYSQYGAGRAIWCANGLKNLIMEGVQNK